jgi:hypothetical protein
MRAKVNVNRAMRARSRRPTHGFGVDAVEQLARFGGTQHRGLADLHHVFRAAHRRGRVHREHLAHHQPVEQRAHCGEPLFDRRRFETTAYILNPGSDMYGLDIEQIESGLMHQSKNSQAAR